MTETFTLEKPRTTVAEEELLTCKNCGNTFTEHFCNRCGQRDAHRITMHHVFHDLVHVFLHADKGIFAFVSNIVFTPGKMAGEFLAGRRKIFNPFQYLILSVGALLFLMNLNHFYENLNSYNVGNASTLPGYFQQAMADFGLFVKKYANIITFLAVPLYALSSWLFFKRKGHNYPEHMTVIVFAIAQANTFNIILLLVLLFLPSSTFFGSVSASMVLTIFSFVVTYQQFYRLSWLKAASKGVLVYGVAYFLQVLLMGIGIFTYIMILRGQQ